MLTQEQRASLEIARQILESQRQQTQEQISRLNSDIREFNTSIDRITKTLEPDPTSAPPTSTRPTSDKYAFMSVRWAILDLLSSSKPMNTAEIADALSASGVRTKAANFANNVSAVLSTNMKEQHDEVRQLPGGLWELTENGKRAIEHIRVTSKFRASTRGRSARF